jgi:quercetin dioxygenase-like cupin family protein
MDFWGDEPEGVRREAEEVLSRWAATIPRAPDQADRSSKIQERLFHTLRGPERFRPFFERLQAIVDLNLPALREVLGRIDAEEGWVAAPFPSVRYLNFTPGPRANAQEGGLVRLAKGAAFPRHHHHGHETACVLEGVLHLGDGRYPPGSILESTAGSTHEFSAGPMRDLVFIVAHNGVEF